MFKLLGKIFGSDKAVDAIIKGADAAIFTPEEKAKHFIRMAAMYEAFKLAQRLLAMAIIPPYVLCAVLYFGAEYYFFLNDIDKDHIMMINFLSDTQFAKMAWLVTAFYFGSGLVEGTIKSFKTNQK